MYKKSKKNTETFQTVTRMYFKAEKKNSTVTHNMGIEVMQIGPPKMGFSFEFGSSKLDKVYKSNLTHMTIILFHFSVTQQSF